MQNLLQKKGKDTPLQISKPRIRLVLIGTQEGNLLRCYVKDTNFKVGDKVSFFTHNGSVYLAYVLNEEEDYYTIKQQGLIEINKDVLLTICEWTKAAYPQLGKPSCIYLKKNEDKWILK